MPDERTRNAPERDSGELLGRMRELRDVLGAEREALITRNVDMLTELAARKETLLRDAADLGARIMAAPDDFAGQHELVAVLTDCRQLNDANGALILNQRCKVERTLNVLRGAPEPSPVYERDGSSSTLDQGRRTLASA